MEEIKVMNLWKSFKKEREAKTVLSSLRKPFNKKTFQAVKGISFSVRKKDFFGLLGSNGAGKSVTLACISTLLIPDKGLIEVQGTNIVESPRIFREKMNVVLGDRLLYHKLSCRENLEFYAGLYGLSLQERKKVIPELFDRVGLKEEQNTLFEDLSTGMKQRLAIARALINDPEILLLDEPTLGIDAAQQRELHELFKELNKEKTIVLTSHYMKEVEELCNNLVIMNNGKIIAQGTVQELIDSLKRKACLQISFKGSINRKALQELLPLESVIEGNSIRVVTRTPEEIVQEFIKATNDKLTITKLEISKPCLEDAFIELTKKENACEEVAE